MSSMSSREAEAGSAKTLAHTAIPSQIEVFHCIAHSSHAGPFCPD
jgi:hypothetical protein